MRKLKITFLVFISVFASLTYCQDAEPEIDASKPTNFYSMLDNTLEFSSRPNENVLGYRGKITYAPSASHLVLADWIQLFPIVSYQYASAPLSEAAQNSGIKETHGITFQILAPIVFSEKFFM